MEFLAEIFLEIYFELAEILLPEKKFKKWQETLLKISGILVSLIIIGCLFAGISLIVDNVNGTVGIVLTAVGGVLFGVQMTLFFVVLAHQIKAEKAAKKKAAKETTKTETAEENKTE